MIFFKPTVNTDNENEIHFEAIENNEVYGKCTLITENNKARIISLSYAEDKPHFSEGLIKSAFNYACSKNCYMGYCECGNVNGIFDRMNLIKEGDIYYNDIPSILQGNCCKNH